MKEIKPSRTFPKESEVKPSRTFPTAAEAQAAWKKDPTGWNTFEDWVYCPDGESDCKDK